MKLLGFRVERAWNEVGTNPRNERLLAEKRVQVAAEHVVRDRDNLVRCGVRFDCICASRDHAGIFGRVAFTVVETIEGRAFHDCAKHWALFRDHDIADADCENDAFLLGAVPRGHPEAIFRCPAETLCCGWKTFVFPFRSRIGANNAATPMGVTQATIPFGVTAKITSITIVGGFSYGHRALASQII